MGRLYTITQTGITPNVSNDLLTILATTAKPLAIKRIRVSGEAASSTAMRTVIQRSTGGTTGGGAVTPEECSTGGNAAALTAYTTWSAQPTLAGSPHYVEGWNAFGGGFDLTLDGREIVLVGTEQLSIRNTVGTGAMNLMVEVEEL